MTTKTKVTNAQLGLTVHELGEDGDRWLVLGTMDERVAREAVIRWVVDLEADDMLLAEVVHTLLDMTPQPGWGWYFATTPNGDGVLRHAERAAEGSTAVSHGVAFGIPRIKHEGRPDKDPAARRTRRRFAHELYPHAAEGETRLLAVEVPYLLARAHGLRVWGTGWSSASPGVAGDRISELIAARHIAFLADALLQGMAGEEAWEWADSRASEESGEWVHERAVHYGVELGNIKPYPCGPIPQQHDHWSSSGYAAGHGRGTRIDGPEEACEICTELLAPAVVASGE